MYLPAEGGNDGGLTDNPYPYNGKELHADFGLGWYAYGARYYDPVLGRFTGVDPISDRFPHVTTYNYAENEPVAHIDLWGLQKYFAATGEFIWQKGEDKTLRVINSTLQDCQGMTCSELEINGIEVQEATLENKEAALSEWASRYQRKSSRYSNAPGGDREYAMSLFSSELKDYTGKTIEAFVEGNTVEGFKGVDGVSLSKSKSPIDGWKSAESIHTHRWGDDSGAFSDDPGIGGKYIQGDIQTAIKTKTKLYLVVPYSGSIGSFDPKIYEEKISSGMPHDLAKSLAIERDAIKIKK